MLPVAHTLIVNETATVTQTDTTQIRIGNEHYEALRRLAFDNRSSIREEADRMIAAGLASDSKKAKRG